jgi:hypothetical protein
MVRRHPDGSCRAERLGNKGRLAAQSEARTNTVVKLAITGLAGGAALYSALLGKKIGEHAVEGAEGVTEPGASASEELAAAQSKQRILQWVLPVLTGVLVVLGAQQGEQQRPAAGFLHRLTNR